MDSYKGNLEDRTVEFKVTTNLPPDWPSADLGEQLRAVLARHVVGYRLEVTEVSSPTPTVFVHLAEGDEEQLADVAETGEPVELSGLQNGKEVTVRFVPAVIHAGNDPEVTEGT